MDAQLDAQTAKQAATQSLAAATPHNANKAAEHGDLARNTPTGAAVTPSNASATGSTLTEGTAT